ncbi:anaphase-promoting complex subunit 10 [Eurytemora carolleeae]|uniref:anaphase-promoting complex subunit 10 n=1 Tax=Eurytemora carolleeae TaxID=1294199 RepID=UPI000C783A43|nr:anaphase-promoting complex subunit 10 [Eurytemora carolleeae]|eukprot:XP_023319594.1 anaphase-promoting complex subunit 10-like [Eurytemora affinis]
MGDEQPAALPDAKSRNSDGQLPHLVNIQFKRKTTIQDVALYTDFKLDESYTPTRISVRVGTNFNDLQEIEVIDISEPNGWIIIPLKDMNDKLVRTFMLQIAVLQNHQQGRDTHMRQIKIHSPVQNQPVSSADFATFANPDFKQFQSIR